MKLPQTFMPEKNLDDKTRKLTRNFKTIDDLIEEKIGAYYKEKAYHSSDILDNYEYIKSAVERANVYYQSPPYSLNKEVDVTIFRFNTNLKFCLKELSDEIKRGKYNKFEHIYCLVKDEFAVIIRTLTQQEDLELFKKHYQNKFGFC
ncbi:MAG: hypothetical protein Q8N77_04440 [Nanoarchaeota archaeon]|nr:hypothetical protein [Nanoarchaeota archaeon]